MAGSKNYDCNPSFDRLSAGKKKVRSVADAPFKETEPKGAYNRGEQVYVKEDRYTSDSGRRYWICCIEYRDGKFYYRLKDGPEPYGKFIKYAVERSLEMVPKQD